MSPEKFQAPVDGESSELKDGFCESLNHILVASDPEERIIVLKDTNGWVGVNLEGTYRVLGQFVYPKLVHYKYLVQA